MSLLLSGFERLASVVDVRELSLLLPESVAVKPELVDLRVSRLHLVFKLVNPAFVHVERLFQKLLLVTDFTYFLGDFLRVSPRVAGLCFGVALFVLRKNVL